MELHHYIYIFVILQIVPLIERPKSAISSVDLTRNSAAEQCANKDIIYIIQDPKALGENFYFYN